MSFSFGKTIAAAIFVMAITPAQAADSPVVQPPKDKLICKTETVIGSLIPGPRRCHTRQQWEEHARAGQAIARKLVEDGTGRPTTN